MSQESTSSSSVTSENYAQTFWQELKASEAFKMLVVKIKNDVESSQTTKNDFSQIINSGRMLDKDGIEYSYHPIIKNALMNFKGNSSFVAAHLYESTLLAYPLFFDIHTGDFHQAFKSCIQDNQFWSWYAQQPDNFKESFKKAVLRSYVQRNLGGILKQINDRKSNLDKFTQQTRALQDQQLLFLDSLDLGKVRQVLKHPKRTQLKMFITPFWFGGKTKESEKRLKDLDVLCQMIYELQDTIQYYPNLNHTYAKLAAQLAELEAFRKMPEIIGEKFLATHQMRYLHAANEAFLFELTQIEGNLETEKPSTFTAKKTNPDQNLPSKGNILNFSQQARKNLDTKKTALNQLKKTLATQNDEIQTYIDENTCDPTTFKAFNDNLLENYEKAKTAFSGHRSRIMLFLEKYLHIRLNTRTETLLTQKTAKIKKLQR